MLRVFCSLYLPRREHALASLDTFYKRKLINHEDEFNFSYVFNQETDVKLINFINIGAQTLKIITFFFSHKDLFVKEFFTRPQKKLGGLVRNKSVWARVRSSRVSMLNNKIDYFRMFTLDSVAELFHAHVDCVNVTKISTILDACFLFHFPVSLSFYYSYHLLCEPFFAWPLG